MSIEALISQLESQGKIRRFTPKGRRPARRRLYLAPPARVDYDDDASAINLLVGRGYITAALTRWTLGERVYKGFLKRLKAPPPEIWEVRVTEPVTHARLFGRFACADTLVLTKFHTRRSLGNRDSSAWPAAMADCEKTWVGLFTGIGAHTGATIHDFVTENCDDFAI